ncbi:head decoration protein [Methylocystis bryophila]|uniref:head decoration protein n=1 Tax=Methylocystis bryophila TaxID=655015 RepID=UPI00131A0367|nr:head decoration protein [Methylocystis bryophila]
MPQPGYSLSECRTSRRHVLFAAGVAAAAGTVLGVKAEGNIYWPLTPEASDGTQTPSAILFDEVAPTLSPRVVTVSINIVANRAALIWPPGVTAEQISTFETQLASVANIAVRDA